MSAPSAATDRLLEGSNLSVERLPVLAAIFERLRASGTQALQHLSPAPLNLKLAGVTSVRIGEALEAAEGKAVATVFQSPAWEARVLVTLERPCLYAMLEAMLGADGTEPPVEEERPFTNLEKRLARLIAEHVAQVLGRAFSTVSHTTFEYERTETQMELAAVGRREDSCLVVRLHLQTLERGGDLTVLIPQRAIHPLRRQLTHAARSEPAAGSPFSAQMQKEVQRAEVSLKAVLEERRMTLGELSELKVGQRIQLQATPRGRVKVECNDQALFWCELGQTDGAYTVRVEDFVDREEEYMDDILARSSCLRSS